MGCLLNTVIACLLVGLTASSTHTYKAGIVSSHKPIGVNSYARFVHIAAKSNIDILVLPTPYEMTRSSQKDNYDEVLKEISSLAKEHKIYIVSQLLEKTRCHENTEVIRSNLVFDRQGTLISVYRKPLDPAAPCNSTATDSSFVTDFGVTFGVLMPEDLVLRNLGADIKNFVVAGEWDSEIPALSAPQFYTAWAFTTNGNLVSPSGIFSGKAGQTGHGVDVVVAELKKDGEVSTVPVPPVAPAPPRGEPAAHYSARPLGRGAGAGGRGLSETVCHGQFCCRFHVKTSGSEDFMKYGLAAFEGTRQFGKHHIGTQICAVLPCVGTYKRSCDVGSINNTNVIFDEITITGNFKSKNSAQYPIIMSTDTLSNSQFAFDNKNYNNTNQITIKLHNSEKLVNFGIFGRDFSKDFVEKTMVFDDNDGLTYKIYEYINSEGVQDFFDYVWIRLRVVIFVVSIYVLEMM